MQKRVQSQAFGVVWRVLCVVAWFALDASALMGAARPDGKLMLTVLDEESRAPIPVRIVLRDARGRLVRIPRPLPDGVAATEEGLYFDGSVTLALPRGAYQFVVEAGPEFLTRPGNFQIDRHAEDSHEITLGRRVDMEKEGWLAGDLDAELASNGLDLVMRARGMDVAAVASVVNDFGRCRRKAVDKLGEFGAGAPWSPLIAALDNRRGGGLLYVGLGDRTDICAYSKEGDSLASLEAARNDGAFVLAAAADAWDLPLWVAKGKLDGVQVIHRSSLVDGVADSGAGARPRPARFFPGKLGVGQYNEAIYHHLLNCGLRIPPVAGSGAGFNKNPLGANRTYVYCGENRSPDAWLAGLRAGRVSVTNGPLLRTDVEGHPPGHVFSIARGEQREFAIGLNLAFYEASHVEYLEIVKNGQPIHQVRLDELAKNNGRLPLVAFDASGWFCVRAVTDNANVYQWAMTGPYYVESDYQPHVSRKSAQFFLDWIDEAEKKFADNKLVASQTAEARAYWQSLSKRATVD